MCNYNDLAVNAMASELKSIIKKRNLFSNDLDEQKNAWIAIMVDLLIVDGKCGDFEGVRNGRYFTYLTEKSFDMLMKPIHGFMKEKIWVTGDVRQDRGTEQWLNIILRKVTTI